MKMKTNMMIAAIAVLLLGLASCNKDESATTQSDLNASKTEQIKLGEPVNFTLAQAPSSAPVQWTILPDEDVQVNATGNKASILFNSPGDYIVNASYGDVEGSIDVVVQDSIYNPSGGEPVYESLDGDQVFITVTRVDSMGISGLEFSYITEKKYDCLNHTLLFGNDFTSEGLRVVFSSVYIPSEEFCEAGEDYATGGTSWYPIEDGSHVFEVFLAGTTYTGSIVKSGSNYTFTWPYTSGVTLTPLIIR
jgi:hypothetical protein